MSTQAVSIREQRAAIIETTEAILPKALWKEIIWQYIPFEALEIDPSYSLFRSYVDLGYLERYLPKPAGYLLRKIYEIAPRFLGKDQKYGVGNRMDAEVFAYTTQLVKQAPGDFVVCVLACAHGENGILLAYAGAKKVILNELSPTCIGVMQKELARESEAVKEICEIDQGDCCDILKRKPSLKNKVDLLICCNLIYYLNKEKQVKFFEMIHNLLKSGGQAVFTAQSIYAERSLQTFEGTETFFFRLTTCFVHNDSDATQGSFPCLSFAATFVPDESEQTRRYQIYEKNGFTQFLWHPNNTQFRLLDKLHRKAISAYLKKHKATLQAIPEGIIEVLSIRAAFYNRSNFKTLFENWGFIPLEVFVCDKKGHLIPRDVDPFIQGEGVGILVVKPSSV